MADSVQTDAFVIDGLKALVREAGDAIMAVYSQDDFSIRQKEDNSPVTAADQKAHDIISQGLKKLAPQTPILSEEGEIPSLAERSQWQDYWLVDPLDGTKEFIARTDEFTVNIALMKDNHPVFGIIYAPVFGVSYYGGSSVHGSWRQKTGEQPEQITTRSCAPEGVLNIAISRHHGQDILKSLIDRLEQRFSEVHTTVAGSSLKACLVADGSLDIYPRKGPTSEWDTAAAQAIIEGAGGKVINKELSVLTYNHKESLINPDFYVLGDPSVEWDTLLL